eukprot:10667663-Karenia_brevis.AAC.1
MIPFRFVRAGYIPPRGVQQVPTVSTEEIDNEIARAANAVAAFPPSFPPPSDVPRAPQEPMLPRRS